MKRSNSYTGLFIALSIIVIWAICLVNFLNWNFSWSNPLVYPAILLQMHLYTGLFITAHDAMHGTVTANKALNNLIGGLCTMLYALFPFRKLYTKHHEHHRHVHSAADPDYHDGNFFAWYFNFIKTYITWWQVVIMATIFNVLKFWIAEPNLIIFWVLPSLLSTLQLFYFGTWLPHHGDHDNQHQSSSFPKNHLLAFLTCYFFGYHFEHHDSPGTPWWKLWQLK
jgi:beta-carotene ketolase (CrtW type)